MRRREFTSVLGGAALWPLASRAQQQDRPYRLSILAQVQPGGHATSKRERHWTAFFDELRRLGHDEGHNVTVTWHSSEGDLERVAELARGVAAHKPDAIFAPDVRMAVLLKTAAAQIPVVAIIVDPVGSGVAVSMARPGGNVTGFTTTTGPEFIAKRLEIFRQAVPTASRVALLTPRRLMDLHIAGATRESVRMAGMTLVEVVLEAPIDAATFRRAFDDVTHHGVDSVWVAQSGETRAHGQLIADLAIGAKLPSLFGWRENVEAGGLISYGVDVADIYRRSAGYVDRVLRGAKPGELPIQQPTRFEVVVNLKTAKALGLTLSPALLVRADEVIE